MQAVVDRTNATMFITFFIPGSISYDDLSLSVNIPCILMVKKLSTDRVDIYVADPTQLESQVNLKVNDHEQIIKLPSGDYAGSTVHLKIHK